jgi:hypothetical protein
MRSSCFGGLPVHEESSIVALQTARAMDFIVLPGAEIASLFQG